jgi:hypothetical protein
MFLIERNDQRLVEEYLLCLGLADTMRVSILSLVARIPVEPCDY